MPNNVLLKSQPKLNAIDSLLEITNLWVEYRTLEGTTYAINGVDLSLNKGESLGLVGETGAGKTTLSKTILKILPKQAVINQGNITFNQKNLLKMKSKEIAKIRGRQISMVFQDPLSSLDPLFPIIHQIAETVKIHENISWSEAKNISIEMLKQVGITPDRANHYPHEFSGGMVQRVMIAIALVCKPRLLIADEPTTALDVTIQAQILELIKKLKVDYGTSLILISHNLGILPGLCDSVAVMYSGRIVEKGDLRSVYNRRLHPYTEGLFNCIPELNNPKKDLKPIKGLPPTLKTFPTGCPFYPRCEESFEKCKAAIPSLLLVEDNHSVACFKYNDDLK